MMLLFYQWKKECVNQLSKKENVHYQINNCDLQLVRHSGFGCWAGSEINSSIVRPHSGLLAVKLRPINKLMDAYNLK